MGSLKVETECDLYDKKTLVDAWANYKYNPILAGWFLFTETPLKANGMPTGRYHVYTLDHIPSMSVTKEAELTIMLNLASKVGSQQPQIMSLQGSQMLLSSMVSSSKSHQSMQESLSKLSSESAVALNALVTLTMKDGRQVKTTVTWDNNDMLDNTATITVVYKDTPQVITIGWNVRDLAHGKVKLNVAGKKAPIFGDFELARNINWNVKSPNQFEMVWDGKVSSNTMETLATPVMTEAKVIYKAGDVDIEMKEMFNAKTFTLMFKTRPFKFAILPFFEI